MVRQHHRRHVWLIALAAGILVPPGVSTVRAVEAMDHSLTGVPGQAQRGRAIATDERKGNCIICHALPTHESTDGAFGDLGPPLAGVGARLSVPALRQRIVDPRIQTPGTAMPAFFVTGYTRVPAQYAGRPILSAQEVEDLVAWLASLQ
jgi:L-cysteine S-thiosulfotransferase